MRTAKLPWIPISLAFVLVLPVQAQDETNKPKREKRSFGKTLEEWLVEVKKSDSGARYSAAKALGFIGSGERVVSALIETLKDNNKSVRIIAADSLGMVGPKAEKAVPALIQALKDNNKSVRKNAATALGTIGQGADLASTEKAVFALIHALKNDEDIRQSAVVALGLIVRDGPAQVRKAIPALKDALKDRESSVREAAQSNLKRIQKKMF